MYTSVSVTCSYDDVRLAAVERIYIRKDLFAFLDVMETAKLLLKF